MSESDNGVHLKNRNAIWVQKIGQNLIFTPADIFDFEKDQKRSWGLFL